jgi:DNA-binding transcriptional MerR regulator
MAYTVKQVACMSGVSVRTLHFYDETGLLKPARHGAHGYRLYEEPQLLTLQQILFYRELGIELKQIKRILSRAEFEKVAALESHREVLQEDVSRTRRLIQTIERTLEHLDGKRKMKSEELFAGFSLAAGKDRFDEHIKLGGEPIDCKLSSSDTGGAMCVFEFIGTTNGPRHLHHDQDEWIYVIEGEFQFDVGPQTLRLCPGESVFIPRKVAHGWGSANGAPGRVIDAYQPAGTMEEFFREVGKYDSPAIHEALSFAEFYRLFQDHGMDLLGPREPGQWKVNEEGRLVRIA